MVRQLLQDTRDRHGAKERHRSVDAGEFHRSYGLVVDIIFGVELRYARVVRELFSRDDLYHRSGHA